MFKDIPLNGLFRDCQTGCVMQKIGSSTAVIFGDPTSPTYTYGSNKKVKDLGQTSGISVNLLLSGESVVSEDPDEKVLAVFLAMPQGEQTEAEQAGNLLSARMEVRAIRASES